MNNEYRYNPQSELQSTKEKISSVEDQSLNRTRAMRQLLSETREVGTKTAEELVLQGEKLQNINRTLDDINEDLTANQKEINKLKGFFGRIKSKFSSKKNDLSHDSLAKSSKSDDKKQKKQNGNLKFENEPYQKPQFATITGSDREKELNNDLVEISGGLNDLKSLALGMQDELERQNPLINNLSNKVEITNARIEHQDNQVKKILGSEERNQNNAGSNNDIMPSKLKLASKLF